MAQTLKFTGYLSDALTTETLTLPFCETAEVLEAYLLKNFPELTRIYYRLAISGKIQIDKYKKMDTDANILVLCPFAGG